MDGKAEILLRWLEFDVKISTIVELLQSHTYYGSKVPLFPYIKNADAQQPNGRGLFTHKDFLPKPDTSSRHVHHWEARSKLINLHDPLLQCCGRA